MARMTLRPMIRIFLCVFVIMLLAGPAFSEDQMYGVTWEGDFYEIDLNTGDYTLLGNLGIPGNSGTNSMGVGPDNTIYTCYRIGLENQWTAALAEVDPQASTVDELMDLGTYPVRSLAISPEGMVYTASKQQSSATESYFHVTDLLLQTVQQLPNLTPAVVYQDGNLAMHGMTFSTSGTLYGWDLSGKYYDGSNNVGFGLTIIDPLTGVVTDVNPLIDDGDIGTGMQALEFTSNGKLYAAGRPGFFEVNVQTGELIPINTAAGYPDIRGLAFIPEPASVGLLLLGAAALLRKRRRDG